MAECVCPRFGGADPDIFRLRSRDLKCFIADRHAYAGAVEREALDGHDVTDRERDRFASAGGVPLCRVEIASETLYDDF